MSIVRENLISTAHYTPYCGAGTCFHKWPRTKFNGTQFECRCGWKSSFEPQFIEQYRAAQEKLGKQGLTARQQKGVCNVCR